MVFNQKMKIFRWSVFLLVFLFLFSGCKRSHSIREANGLVAQGSTFHDFGSQPQNKELFHTFTLTNESSLPIRFLGIKSSCGCTWAAKNDDLMGSILLPGTHLEFPVFISTGTSNSTAHGEIYIIYQYETADESPLTKGHLLLDVKADVLADYYIDPPVLDFGDVKGLEIQKTAKKFLVVADQLETLEISEIHPSTDCLTYRIINDSVILNDGKKAKEVEIELDISSFFGNKELSGSIVFKTNSETRPKGIIHVRANYISPVTINPSSVIISSDKEGEIIEQVQITTSVPSRISTIKFPENLLKLQYDSETKSTCHIVEFNIPTCFDHDFDQTITCEMGLFPMDRASVIRSCFIPIYRFCKGENP